MTKAIKNTADLREMLIQVIGDVRTGKIDSKAAQSISGLSSRILQSAKLDYDVMRHIEGDKTKNIGSTNLLSNDSSLEEKKATT